PAARIRRRRSRIRSAVLFAITAPSRLIIEEPLEAPWCKIGVTHGVSDVAMPEVQLNRSSVVPIISQAKADRMPEHMRMRWKRQARFFAEPSNQPADVAGGHRAAAFAHEQVRRIRPLPPQLAELAKLRATQG